MAWTNLPRVVAMVKSLSFALLIVLSGSANASDMDTYADTLEWQEKWKKVIDVQTGNYADKMAEIELSQLPSAQKIYLADELKNKLRQTFSWTNFGTDFTQNIVDSCGTNLLDRMVGYYSGENISDGEKSRISKAYRNCAPKGIEKSMSMVYSSFDRMDKSKGANKGFKNTFGGIILIREEALSSFRQKYIPAKGHKAFAQSASGNWNWRSARTSKDHAINSALASCRARNQDFENGQPCKIINLNDEWTDIYRKSLINDEDDEAMLISKKALESYQNNFASERKNKAFAQATNGSWSWRSSNTSTENAIEKSLASCRKHNKNHEQMYPCEIVNVNDDWLND